MCLHPLVHPQVESAKSIVDPAVDSGLSIIDPDIDSSEVVRDDLFHLPLDRPQSLLHTLVNALLVLGGPLILGRGDQIRLLDDLPLDRLHSLIKAGLNPLEAGIHLPLDCLQSLVDTQV